MKIDDHGFHRIVVDSEVENEISIACFRKAGFRPRLPRGTSPEVEWVAAPHSLLASEEYRGYDGVRRFWTQFLSAWDEYGVQVDELIDAGDQVVAVMRLSARTNELEVDEARSSLLTLRDGRIVRIEPFASKDDALEAAGKRE